MTQDIRKTNQALNRLIEFCHDGHEGYQTAAHHIEDRPVQLELGRFAHERKEFRDVLARKVDRHAGTPHGHGTLKGRLHRTWLDLKAKVKHLPQPEILQMCADGEEATILTYEHVLEEDLPQEIKELATHQLGLIQKAKNRLAELAGEKQASD